MTIGRYLNKAQLKYLRQSLTIWLIAMALFGPVHPYIPWFTYWHLQTLVLLVAFGWGLYLFKED